MNKQYGLNFIQRNVNEELRAFFENKFSTAEKSIQRAARHGVSNAVNLVRDKVRQNVAAIPYNMTRPSKKWGVPMIEGVKAYMYQGEATGFVDILGNTRTNDGTWLLRMAAGKGTVQRKTKAGYNRGAVQGYYALTNAIDAVGSGIVKTIQDAISIEIDELNK